MNIVLYNDEIIDILKRHIEGRYKEYVENIEFTRIDTFPDEIKADCIIKKNRQTK